MIVCFEYALGPDVSGPRESGLRRERVFLILAWLRLVVVEDIGSFFFSFSRFRGASGRTYEAESHVVEFVGHPTILGIVVTREIKWR
jgi:hypothetical protein